MRYIKPMVAAGYCKLHGWKMSWRQIRQKSCLDPNKQCHRDDEGKLKCSYLTEYPEHPVWEQRRKAREERKKRKEERRVKNEGD